MAERKLLTPLERYDMTSSTPLLTAPSNNRASGLITGMKPSFHTGFLAAEQFNNTCNHRDDDMSNLTSSIGPISNSPSQVESLPDHGHQHHHHHQQQQQHARSNHHFSSINEAAPAPANPQYGYPTTTKSTTTKKNQPRVHQSSSKQQQQQPRYLYDYSMTDDDDDDAPTSTVDPTITSSIATTTYEVFATVNDDDDDLLMGGCDAGGTTTQFLAATIPSMFPNNHLNTSCSSSLLQRNQSINSYTSRDRGRRRRHSKSPRKHHYTNNSVVTNDNNDNSISEPKRSSKKQSRVRRRSGETSLSPIRRNHRQEEVGTAKTNTGTSSHSYNIPMTMKGPPNNTTRNATKTYASNNKDVLLDFGRRLGECMVGSMDVYDNPCYQGTQDFTATTTTTQQQQQKTSSSRGHPRSSGAGFTISDQNSVVLMEEEDSDEGRLPAVGKSAVDNDVISSRQRARKRVSQDTPTMVNNNNNNNNNKSEEDKHSTTSSYSTEPSFTQPLSPPATKKKSPFPFPSIRSPTMEEYLHNPCATMNDINDEGGERPTKRNDKNKNMTAADSSDNQHDNDNDTSTMRDFRLRLFECDHDTVMVLQARLARAVSDLAASDDAIRKLQKDLADARRELAAQKQQLEQQQQQKNNDSSPSQGSGVRGEGETVSSSNLISLRTEIVFLRSQLAHAKAELLKSKTDVTTIEKTADGSSAENTSLQKQVQTLQEILFQSQEKVELLMREKESLASKGENQIRDESKNNDQQGSYVALKTKLEAAEKRIVELSNKSQVDQRLFSETKRALTEALEQSRDEVSSMRNQLFNNKLKLAQAESRAESFEYATNQRAADSIERIGGDDVVKDVVSCSITALDRRDDQVEVTPEKALEKSLELEEANQEIISLRLQLAKAKSESECQGCPHSADLADLDRLRFTVQEMQQEVQHLKAREALQKDLFESETKRHEIKELELSENCHKLEAELYVQKTIALESETIKSELRLTREQLAGTQSEVVRLQGVVQEVENKLIGSERSCRALETEVDSARTQLQQIQRTLALQRELSSSVADFNSRQCSAANHALAISRSEIQKVECLLKKSMRSSLCMELMTTVTLEKMRTQFFGASGGEQRRVPPSITVERGVSPTSHLNDEVSLRSDSDNSPPRMENNHVRRGSGEITKVFRKGLKLSNELDELRNELQVLSKRSYLISTVRLSECNTNRSDHGTTTETESPARSKAEQLKLELRRKEMEYSENFPKRASTERMELGQELKESREANLVLKEKILQLDDQVARTAVELRLVKDQLAHAQRRQYLYPILDRDVREETKVAEIEEGDAVAITKTSIREAEDAADNSQGMDQLSELRPEISNPKTAWIAHDYTLRQEMEEILLLLKDTKDQWQEDTKRFEREQNLSKEVEMNLLAEIDDLKARLEPKQPKPESAIAPLKKIVEERTDSAIARLLAKASEITRRKSVHSDSCPNDGDATWASPSRSRPDDEPPISSLKFKTPQRDNRSSRASSAHESGFLDERTLYLATQNIGKPNIDSNASVSTISFGKAMSDVSMSQQFESDSNALDLPQLCPPPSSRASAVVEDSSIASESSILSPPVLSATAVLSNLPVPVPIRPRAMAESHDFPPRSSSAKPLELVSKLKLFFENNGE